LIGHCGLKAIYLIRQELDLATRILVFGRQLGERGHNFRPIEAPKPSPKGGLAAFTGLQ
jgi:hypothetical protein